MSFPQLLEHYRIETAPPNHHHRRNGWTQIDCPNCGKDSRKFHLGFNDSGGYFNCWKCGRLPLKQTIAEIFNVSWSKAGELCKSIRQDLPEPETKIKKTGGKLVKPYGIGPCGKRHRRYLKSRGFDPDEITNLWEVGGIGISSPISWSLYIPIIFRGKVVSWTTRKCRDDVGQRYFSAKPEQEVIEHKNILYGLDYVRHCVIIHEGPTDVWKVGPGAVGTFGTAFLTSQIRLLAEIPRRIICFDNSPDAQRSADRLADLLAPFDGRTEVVQLDADDPGSASKKEVRRLRRFAGLPDR